MKIRILYILVLIATAIFAQDFSKKKITTILVIGNDNTKEEVIKREILLQPGQLFNDSLRVLSEQRILNLFLFNHVEIIPIPDDDDVSLLVNVTERYYLFPFPEFRIEDRDWEKLTYGFGLAHLNFRGKNEKLFGIVVFGYRPGYQLQYYNPWFGDINRYTSSIFLNKYSTLHKTLNLNENHFVASWTVGRYWLRNLSSNLGVAYENIRVSERWAPNMLTSKQEENLASLSFSLIYDDRDLQAYPAKGWYTNFSFTKKGFFQPGIDFSKYTVDLRHYKSFGKITFAARTYFLLSSGDLPLYQQVYLGFNERIRGHFSEISGPSRNSFLTTFEIRFPILPIRLFNLPSGFMPASTTQNLQFGLNGAFFYDSGTTWSEKNQLAQGIIKRPLDIKNFLTGFGFGLHFRLPYLEVARLEVGFNEDLNSEIIFEIGTAL